MELICIKAIFRSDLKQIAAQSVNVWSHLQSNTVSGTVYKYAFLSTETVMYVSLKVECRLKTVDISQLNRV